MKTLSRTRSGLVAMAAVAALTLAACSDDADTDEDATTPEETSAETSDDADADAETEDTEGSDDAADTPAAEVTDMGGNTVAIPSDPQSIIATDNRIFTTLAEWDVELSGAPVDLMPEGEDILSVYIDNPDIENIGNHREPDLEVFVTAAPDLILNGQRFTQYEKDIRGLIGDDTAFVNTDIDIENNTIDEELRALTTLLGDVFGRQAEAEQLIADFDASIERAAEAYDPEWSVVGLLASGGSINYVAPSTGRAIGPVYDVLDLTPALDREGSTNHQGDDISVEAIAESNPDWILVLDRDSGAGTEDAATAQELIADSEALQNVTAVQEGNIIYLNPNFYTAEDIQHYTELFNDMADAFEAN